MGICKEDIQTELKKLVLLDHTEPFIKVNCAGAKVVYSQMYNIVLATMLKLVSNYLKTKSKCNLKIINIIINSNMGGGVPSSEYHVVAPC